MKKLKVKTKINSKKIEDYQDLISILIEDGRSMYINEDSISMYPDNERCFSLVLNINGTWKLE